MDKVEITNEDICRMLDSMCHKLNGGLDPIMKNTNSIWNKVQTLNFAVTNYINEHSEAKEAEYLKDRIKSLEKKMAHIQRETIKLEEEKKALIERNRKQSLEISNQLRKIQEHQREIGQLQRILQEYTKPKTKVGNKNAYKNGVDPEQVYMDIEHGMSKTEAAKKYNVSRDTIRKRYKEGKQILGR